MWMATGKGRIFVNYLQWNRDGIKISGFQKVGNLVRLKTREGFAYKQKFKKNISIETLCKKVGHTFISMLAVAVAVGWVC